MLYLFSCAAHGIKPDNKPDSSLDEIYMKAMRQGVLPLVLVAIKDLDLDDKTLILFTPLSNHIDNLRKIAISNIQGNSIVYNAIKQLKESDISCCVLKGATVAGLYSNKDFRISMDTDLYIDADNKKIIKKAIKIFEEHGFIFSGIPPNSNHYIAHHKNVGLLELHYNLYHELFADVWFDNKTALTEPFRMVKTYSNLEIPALGITDGYIYMCLHIIKHFLAEGIGIRPIMDFLLYTKQYKEEIDYSRFSEIMHHLKYNKFIDVMMCIGVMYLGFSKEDFFPFDCDEAVANEVLTDIESGGLFGHDEEWRKGFRMTYNEQRFKRFKGDDYSEYMKTWEFKRKFHSGYVMKQRYPFVVRYGFLLPIAWIHRIVNYVIRSIFSKSKTNDYLDERVRERLNLILELDMI
jgi:hypothetical protein